MSVDQDTDARTRPTLARQGAGFLVSGIIALGVDMGVTSALTRGLAVSPYLSRPVGIAVAMVTAWLLHRRLTFAVAHPPSLAEFGRYAAVGSVTAAVNYGTYAATLYAAPGLAPETALIIASLVAMVVSFLGLKFGVFHRPD